MEENKVKSAVEILDEHFPHSFYTPVFPKNSTPIHNDECERCKWEEIIYAAMEAYHAQFSQLSLGKEDWNDIANGRDNEVTEDEKFEQWLDEWYTKCKLSGYYIAKNCTYPLYLKETLRKVFKERDVASDNATIEHSCDASFKDNNSIEQ